VGFDQHLGTKVPADLVFNDENGSSVRLGDYLGRRPLILMFVYFRCPMLCGEELKGLTRCLRAVGPSVGDGFDVITVSFDPSETPNLAAAKKQSVLEVYDRPRGQRGWHFLTGTGPAIESLTNAVGFRYSPIRDTQQYAHAAGIVVLSPDGLITRYFFGIDYPSKDVQASLQNAAAEHVEPPVAKWLMLCYDYDPSTGKYTLAVMRLVQILAAFTLCVLVGGVGFLLRRDARHRSTAPTLVGTSIRSHEPNEN
jgi:protein SCO1/2